MNLTAKFKRLLKRKIATVVLLAASMAAFATLGDGGKKGNLPLRPEKLTSKNFSLRANYNLNGNSFLNSSNKFITLKPTSVTYRKGNATYIIPAKKKVLLDKIKFNPAPVRF